MTEPHLTIAIPTFDRPEQLRATLRLLVPQLRPECTLLILDNASPSPVADLLSAAGWDKNDAVKCLRHPVNIGMAANIVRCFETARTPWLVVLGDDDEICPDYMEAMLAAIRENPDALYGTFSTSIFTRPRSFVTEGLDGFIRAIDDWSNVLFVSCCIFHRERLVRYLRYGYLYAYSLAPHIAMLLRSLRENGGRCFFSSKMIVNNRRHEDTVTWSRVNISNTALVIELVPDRATRQIFFDRMATTFLSVPALALRLAERAVETGEDNDLLFRFRAFTATCLASPLRSALLRTVLGFLVRHPRLAEKLAALIRTLSGRKRVHATESDIHAGV